MIFIAPYNPSWPDMFADARRELDLLFHPTRVSVEHIGSTSVPGLGAKPIIDILLGAPSLAVIESRIPALGSAGYLYTPQYEDELPERRYFSRAVDGVHTHHLHAVVTGGGFWLDHIAFRDALRTIPGLMADYEQLKRELAVLHAGDRMGYTDAKTEFIRAAVQRFREGA